MLDQQLQQAAVAATEIEYPLAGLHPAGNDVEIASCQRVGHVPSLFRNATTTAW